MKALLILVGILCIATAVLACMSASGMVAMGPKRIDVTLAAGMACGFAILGGLCFVAYALLILAAKMAEASEMQVTADRG